METTEKGIMRFLKGSLIAVALFCVIIYYVQTYFVNLLSEKTIKQMGVIYMSGMSEQTAAHFGSIIELRIAQVEALVDAVPPGRFKTGVSPQVELTYNARSAGFDHLAFYTEEGEFRMIYGAQVTATVPEALRRSVQGGKYNVCAGVDETGVPVALVGVPVKYPMSDGETSIGLIAGLPVSYLGETLEGSIKAGMMEYSIIRDDGSYVIQSKPGEEANYFERIQKLYEPYNGKQPEQYAKELQDALERDRNYTEEIMLSGERWNVYLSALPNSEWHLLLKMPHNDLDESVAALKSKCSAIFSGGCGLMLGALLLVFLGYYRMSRRQIHVLNEARESAERSNRVKNEFLSNMSHDIRTPMNGIMGMTSIAIESLGNPPRVRNCLRKINVSSRYLLGLINDMLDMAKIESGKLALRVEPVNLREIMQNITTGIMPQVQEKNQQFHAYVHNIHYEDVCSDRVRLSQILLNMLGNAVKFTPEGGTIVAELREEPSPKGDAYIRSCLHIGDNGIGMSEEFQSRIFEGFAREDSDRVSKEAGAGMGMAIVKAIVDAMGGTITVKSEQGRGSDFYVIVDMEKASLSEKEFSLPAHSVLVVDDDATAAETAVATLESIGLQGEWALSLNQARQAVEKHSYSIVLVDWNLEGGDGIKAAETLHACLEEGAVVVLLADGDNDELEVKAEAAGLAGLIAKPLFRSSLYYGLRRFTEGAAQSLPEEEEEMNLEGVRILVAEDNEMNWEIAETLLSGLGAELDWAENGKICVEKLAQSPEGWYDAVLMDLRMPVMTGYEATHAIREMQRKDASLPIIAISADAFADDVEKCLNCGMNAHTSKPFNLKEVTNLLWKFLHGKADKTGSVI